MAQFELLSRSWRRQWQFELLTSWSLETAMARMMRMVICMQRLHLDSAAAAAPESYLWQSQYGFGTI